MRSFFPMLVLGVLAAHATHVSALSHQPPMSTRLDETLPSESALHFSSLGYKEIVADYYWLRAIHHFGDDALHKYLYPNLILFFQRILSLDPYFAGAYVFAGTVLTIKGMDPKIPIAMLEEGLKHRPDVWRIPFMLGFNRYYFLGEYAAAAKALGKAAKLPGSPSFTGVLAARLAAQGGTPEIGLQLIDSLLETTSDPDMRKEYENRGKRLLLEIHLRELNRALVAFEKAIGTPAKTWDELVAQGFLASIPQDPLGGSFSLERDGRAHSDHEDQVLRLSDEALATPGATP